MLFIIPYSISSSDLPTPANTISLGVKPKLMQCLISFALTASIPKLKFFITLKILGLVLDLTEK